MRNSSIVTEANQIQMSVDLIKLGARLQLLQEETAVSRDRLIRLYKEIKGNSPPKGMLPYSTDWFISWAPNIHSSLFMGIYNFLISNASLTTVEALIKAYRLYLEQIALSGDEVVLSITRAWFLVRFFDAKMMQLTDCKECGGRFVVHSNELCTDYVCGICRPPSRAGKTASKQRSHAQHSH